MGKKVITPKAKAAPKKTAAKSKANMSKLARAAKAKVEKNSPRPQKKGPKAEIDETDAQTSESTKGLGYPRGTISALITSLKYQAKAKKVTEDQRADCMKTLSDTEYQSGDLATQRSILNNLSKFGVQNCSWVHTLHKTTTNTEVEAERLRTNFLTRKAIFKLQGVEHKDLSEEEQAEVLEELLTAQEKLFGYERHVERHGKFRVLDRFLFKWSEGQTLDTATTSQTQSVSTATNLKKTGSARAVEMMKHGGSLTEGDGDGEPSTAKPSESFGLLKEKRRELERGLAFRPDTGPQLGGLLTGQKGKRAAESLHCFGRFSSEDSLCPC
ncbi:unnamed protein product [Symbiodinium natans]|uniref:Uncharacterized protein n=1 Tax=Symbiodinium natans TaxID=878477 RepID=A0A812S4R9_9DINO|nr:unnamed protein product [Symbiodinium natans]